MPSKLRKLKITHVAVCEQGANYDLDTGEGAHILLFKSADVAKQDPAVDTPDPTPVTPSAMPPIGTIARPKRKRALGKQTMDYSPMTGWHSEPDADALTEPLDYATRGQQQDLWRELLAKWERFCGTFYDCVGDMDADNVACLPILSRSIGQFQDDVAGLLRDLDLVEKTAAPLATLHEVSKAGAPMAGHRLTRLREAIQALQQILDECTPAVIDRPGVSAADVTGIPRVMKTSHQGAPAMAVRKNEESDKEHCESCDDKDCDNPAHERMKKETVVSGNVAQAQIDALTTRAEKAEAEVATLRSDLAKAQTDLATLQEESRIAKMSPEEQRETMLASMPDLIRKNYLDQETRLELIEKANRDLQEKNERLDYIQKAAGYRAMGFVPDDHWEILKAIDTMPEAPRTELTRLLKAATEQLKTSPWMTTVGSQSVSPTGSDGSAEQQILALATAHQAEKGGSLGDAITAVAKAHPDLWARDQQEKRFKNRVESR